MGWSKYSVKRFIMHLGSQVANSSSQWLFIELINLLFELRMSSLRLIYIAKTTSIMKGKEVI